MRVRTGTSGFAYQPWKGPFYPENAKAADFLRLYAERLPTVEINSTFYRMPKPEVVEGWAGQVPDGFVFAIKASQRITHRARLREADDAVDYLWQSVQRLGPKLGPVLFQLPPNFRADVERLRVFLGGLPDGLRAALEVRHDSWLDESVFAVLRDANAALCVADTGDDDPANGDDADPGPGRRAAGAIPATADWGYLRLRRDGYDDRALRGWADRIAAEAWREAFVFFKHEDAGAAPQLALRLAELLG